MKSNKVIFASAGSGKTYSLVKDALIKSINTNKLILLISYTNEGVECLKQELAQQNHFLTNNKIEIKTWYSFLLNECIKPYQRLLNLKSQKNNKEFNTPPNYINSISFNINESSWKQKIKNEYVEYFMNKDHDLFKDRVSNLACTINEVSNNKAINRLEQIYAYIFIDEVQDYAGWDLDFFDILLNSNIELEFVGDIRQATFRTNNGTKNKQFVGSKIINWFIRKNKEEKLIIIHNNKTRRFNKNICNFVNIIYPNDVSNHVKPDNDLIDNEENQGVFIINENKVEEYCNFYEPIILRWDKRTNINSKLNCQILNYGNAKGITCNRTIIYLTKPLLLFILNQKPIQLEEVKAKFYVACTRAKHSVVFVNTTNDKPSNNFEESSILLGNKSISCYRYKSES